MHYAYIQSTYTVSSPSQIMSVKCEVKNQIQIDMGSFYNKDPRHKWLLIDTKSSTSSCSSFSSVAEKCHWKIVASTILLIAHRSCNSCYKYFSKSGSFVQRQSTYSRRTYLVHFYWVQKYTLVPVSWNHKVEVSEVFDRSVMYCIQSKVPAHDMKTYAKSGIGPRLLNFSTWYSGDQFHALAALSGYRGPFHPAEVQGERAQIIHSTEAWISPKALDVFQKRKSLSPAENWIMIPQSCSPQPSHYTNYTIPRLYTVQSFNICWRITEYMQKYIQNLSKLVLATHESEPDAHIIQI